MYPGPKKKKKKKKPRAARGRGRAVWKVTNALKKEGGHWEVSRRPETTTAKAVEKMPVKGGGGAGEPGSRGR